MHDYELSCTYKSFGARKFDCSQAFTCGFCCASNRLKPSKSCSEVVTNSLKNEQQTRATLSAEIQQAQSRKDAKRLNLIVKRTKPSDNSAGYDIVEKIAYCRKVDVSLVSSDVQCKWIGKPQRDTGNQLLLKFKEMIKRNQFQRELVALRDCKNFDNVYVSPDLTKAEIVQQYNLRLQKRQLESQNPANIYKIRRGRVQQN